MESTLYLLWLSSVVIIILFTLLIVFLLINSPGKAIPFRGNDGSIMAGSISVIETVNINGINQRMIIRGSDITKPVLLYLHGGPGDPEFPYVNRFNPGIEDIFVVCYWDQRGAGLSYSKKIPPETMSLDQFIDDAGKVTKYLLRRFTREKIYLLGHSWGSMLGSFAAQKFPGCYYAFITVGQVGDQQYSEKLTYDFVLTKAKQLKDKEAIKTLQELGSPPYPPVEAVDKMTKERKYVIKYGGAVKEGNLYSKAIKTIIFCKEYSLLEKINYLKGMRNSKIRLWNTIMETNLFRAVPSQKIPVYIIQGLYDYQTTYKVAKDYFDSLNAPAKRFYSFHNSAHSPIFEEPEKFNQILKEILLEQRNYV